MNFSQKLFLFLFFIFFVSCSAEHDGASDFSSNETISNSDPDPALEAAAVNIFNNSCVTCHNGSQVPDLRPSAIASLKNNILYINIGQGSESQLYLRMVNSGSPMPPTGLLPQSDADAIKTWIDDLGTAPDNPDDEPVAGRFSEIEANILTPKCYSCHETNDPIFQNYDDIRNLIVIPYNIDSALYTSITSGASSTGNVMPKNQPPLSQDEISTIESWIMNGALND